MYPVVRGSYEKPLLNVCDRRGLFALMCHTDGRWDDIAGRWWPCLPCLDLLPRKHAARLNSWMNIAIRPTDIEPYYRQKSHVLSRCLRRAKDKGYVAHEPLGQLHEDLRKFG